MANVKDYINNPVNLDLPRAKFRRPQTVKTTFDAGRLIPFYVDEVLPGDTMDITTAFAIRMSTPLNPVMDDCFIDIAYFFVPNRIVLDTWAEVMGENKNTAWIQQEEYLVPTSTIRYDKEEQNQIVDLYLYENTLFDYMGLPVGIRTIPEGETTNEIEVNQLPFRAYVKIYNEFYRAQAYEAPIPLKTNGTSDFVDLDDIQTQDEDYTRAYTGYSKPFLVSKVPDYFTSCLPAPQKGPAVLLPLGKLAPVIPGERNIMTSEELALLPKTSFLIGSVEDNQDTLAIDNNDMIVGATREGTSARITFNNLQADLSKATAATVADLRQAIQMQRFYEKDARGGSRLIEIIKAHFGVTADDARMQRPEMIGGFRHDISMNQVLNTSQAGEGAVGETGAFSLTNAGRKIGTRSFTEHGFVIGVAVVRQKHTYSQGVAKFWTRKQRFDYYWPVFANLSEQAVMKRELDIRAGANEVFGYQEYGADYREKPNQITAGMRSEYSKGSLDIWHYGDNYEKVPVLSNEFIKETAINIDRTLAVSSKLTHQFIADFAIINDSTRVMPLYSIPGLADHH